jgi:pyrophosphate--fructose-6-phosphate 1-phosphotransferase
MELHERKGKLKPVIGKAFVDLQGKPYASLKQNAAEWALEDDYQSPGPIQFFGEPALTDSIPMILQC